MMLSELSAVICSLLSSTMSEIGVSMTDSVDLLVEGPASA